MKLYNSFIELNGRQRAKNLLDKGTFKELLDPFQKIESPYLTPQGIVPESDDGVIIARGKLNNQEVAILSIEAQFQGGGIGEVSGTKIAATLEKLHEENKAGKRIIPIIVFDTGGVRLQEANYGLLNIAEIQSAIVAARTLVPVIGLIPGNVGSFGGMSITASLCSYIIATKFARYGLNGPEVIEQEAGVKEFDSKDKQLIYNTIGCLARKKVSLIDEIVEDDVDLIKEAIDKAAKKKIEHYRTQLADKNLAILNKIDANQKLTLDEIAQFKADNALKTIDKPLFTSKAKDSRGRKWFNLFTKNATSISQVPTVLVANAEFDGKPTLFVSVVPDEGNKFYRARNGEVGLLEGLAIGKYVSDAVKEDESKAVKRNIVCLIDVPSQAYGYNEELYGIHTTCATAVDAYATAREKGHKVVGVIVGNAISGAFLTHGYQSSVLIGINDPKINIQAMSKESAARVTKRSIKEIEEAAKVVPAIAYDIQSFNKLGALEELIEGVDGENPADKDVAKVSESLKKALSKANNKVSNRLENPNSKEGRKMSLLVRQKIAEQWN